ncbi:MAG TPA: NifX-associated nitrogen fixation protein [Anaeromyxobacteraceae bacterium]|nr:NifX-associated nitrogen fixation protein [Anaeromyxobacteraceae bacterium]
MHTSHQLTQEPSFLRELIRQFRAQDTQHSWDGKSDREVLAPLIVTRDKRRDGLAPDEPDPDVFWRIEMFYNAVGLAIEARTGVVCTPMLKMHHEGFGRLALLGGRLVVVNKFLRDVQRFGFESLDKLIEAGEKLVASGIEMIERFPEVARYSE